MKNGRLELIIGCMYSGKTTELIRLIERYESIQKKMMIINYKGDTRYGSDNKIYTHDRRGIDAIHVENIMHIFTGEFEEKYKASDIIFINEGQFFNNLFDFCIRSIEQDDKTVIICGLDGDYKREPFGDILRLIPVSDKITRLTAMCKMCNDGTPGLFTRRIIDSDKQELIGGMESYLPVCRKHY